MSEQKLAKPEQPEADPFAQMIQFYDTWAKSWADVMSQTVASKGFADSMADSWKAHWMLWRWRAGRWAS